MHFFIIKRSILEIICRKRRVFIESFPRVIFVSKHTDTLTLEVRVLVLNFRLQYRDRIPKRGVRYDIR